MLFSWWAIWKPILAASPPEVTIPPGSATGVLDWMLGDVLSFPQMFQYKEAKVLGFSLSLMQGISSSIHMPWGVLQSQSRSYVVLSVLFQKVLFPSRSGTSVRILLDFHSSRSQLSPHNLCNLGIWDQGLCHLWVQPLNSLCSCFSLLLLSNFRNKLVVFPWAHPFFLVTGMNFWLVFWSDWGKRDFHAFLSLGVCSSFTCTV